MDKPRRIQLKRTKGWKMPPNTKKVDRSTLWGNPFRSTLLGRVFPHWGLPAPIITFHEKMNVGRSIDLFTAYIYGRLLDDPDFLEPLRGKNLACWCKEGEPCHADVLLRLANHERGDRDG